MPTFVTRRYSFEAAHFLPKVHDQHKCKRMHGHNYEFEVHIEAPVDDTGFVIDFWDIDKLVDPIIELVDHRVLNDIPGLENPTAELIAEWIMGKLHAGMLIVSAVTVYETKNCSATVRV